LGDVDVTNVTKKMAKSKSNRNPSDFEKAKDVLKGMGITDFDTAEVTLRSE
jgi:hypothetical protein